MVTRITSSDSRSTATVILDPFMAEDLKVLKLLEQKPISRIEKQYPRGLNEDKAYLQSYLHSENRGSNTRYVQHSLPTTLWIS